MEIAKESDDKKLLIYTKKSGCVDCPKLKALLKKNKIAYEEVSIDAKITEKGQKWLEEIVKMTKATNAPYVYAGGNYLGGLK